MPSQTTNAPKTIWFYGKGDTAPDLVKQLIDQNTKTAIDLSGAESVTIEIAHSTYDAYFAPGIYLVQNGPCEIIADPVADARVSDEQIAKYGADGWVAWTPLVGDLNVSGNFSFVHFIKWATDIYQTVKPLAFDYIEIQHPPYANNIPRT